MVSRQTGHPRRRLPRVATRGVSGPSPLPASFRARRGSRPALEGDDVVVIGSGFGGAMVAQALVDAGRQVLMLERGGWVARGRSAWAPQGTLELTPHQVELAHRAAGGGRVRVTSCVGGGSVFYGAVSLRYRERDFEPEPALGGGPGAAWPFGYDALEPAYTAAERVLDVAGEAHGDPCAPWRSAPYPQALPALSAVSQRLAGAAAELGLSPFRLPLAINHRQPGPRSPCLQCRRCDTFACAVGAKNDLATAVLPRLLGRGLTLRPHTSVLRLEAARGRVRSLLVRDERTGRVSRLRVGRVFLAAGALGSAQLLLASGLDALSPARAVLGRYLTRHCSAIVMGVFPQRPDREQRFHKELGLHDLYFGSAERAAPTGPVGSIQQVATPPLALLAREMPGVLRPLAPALRQHLTGLLVMAEDQPRAENRLRVERTANGEPRAIVAHRHTPRDLAARDTLITVAKRVLHRAGAAYCYVHPIDTFSHALGTTRMGHDARACVLDPTGRFRGLKNLWVADGSALPRAAAVNPSLTIAANALRTAAHALDLDVPEHALLAA
jgi:choline dehydrogenase-like flavoprotein